MLFSKLFFVILYIVLCTDEVIKNFLENNWKIKKVKKKILMSIYIKLMLILQRLYIEKFWFSLKLKDLSVI